MYFQKHFILFFFVWFCFIKNVSNGKHWTIYIIIFIIFTIRYVLVCYIFQYIAP